MAERTVLVEAAGHEIAITSPGKVFFPERGETKLDLVRYYVDQNVEGPLMRAMQGRPVLLQRFPNGAGGPSFFQKRVPEQRPEWLQTAVVSTPNGTTSDFSPAGRRTKCAALPLPSRASWSAASRS